MTQNPLQQNWLQGAFVFLRDKWFAHFFGSLRKLAIIFVSTKLKTK